MMGFNGVFFGGGHTQHADSHILGSQQTGAQCANTHTHLYTFMVSLCTLGGLTFLPSPPLWHPHVLISTVLQPDSLLSLLPFLVFSLYPSLHLKFKFTPTKLYGCDNSPPFISLSQAFFFFSLSVTVVLPLLSSLDFLSLPLSFCPSSLSSSCLSSSLLLHPSLSSSASLFCHLSLNPFLPLFFPP